MEIFSPEDTCSILRKAPDGLRPALVFGFFSGLRPSEIMRLSWEDVDLKAGHVYVRGKVRTARNRIAFVPHNAAVWLVGGGKGRVCGYAHPGVSAKQWAAKARIPWIHDGPRHSFVSYRLAVLGDFAKVSEETGTSVKTLRQHYRRPVPKALGEIYFGLLP